MEPGILQYDTFFCGPTFERLSQHMYYKTQERVANKLFRKVLQRLRPNMGAMPLLRTKGKQRTGALARREEQ